MTEEAISEEPIGPSKEEIREAARILKTKGSKKRDRRKAAGVMGLIGGTKGGTNRARNLTPQQRTEIARMGGLARQAAAREKREREQSAGAMPRRAPGRSMPLS